MRQDLRVEQEGSTQTCEVAMDRPWQEPFSHQWYIECATASSRTYSDWNSNTRINKQSVKSNDSACSNGS